MNSAPNVIERIEAILEQKGHKADRKLAEAVGQVDGKLQDINGFSGSQPVVLRRAEYEKDIESRRDTFLSITKQVIQGLNVEQRGELQPSLNDLARKWLGQHVAVLEKELGTLAAHLGVPNLGVNDLGADRVLASLEAELQLSLTGSDSRPESGEDFRDFRDAPKNISFYFI